MKIEGETLKNGKKRQKSRFHTKIKDFKGEKMTERDKLALLNMINKTSELMQKIIESQEEIINANGIKYLKIVSDLHGLIHELIKVAESKGCKVIWEKYKAVKIVEKEGKENEKN